MALELWTGTEIPAEWRPTFCKFTSRTMSNNIAYFWRALNLFISLHEHNATSNVESRTFPFWIRSVLTNRAAPRSDSTASVRWTEEGNIRNTTGYEENRNCSKISEKHLHKDLNPHKIGIMISVNISCNKWYSHPFKCAISLSFFTAELQTTH
jgi:hypothetical protein